MVTLCGSRGKRSANAYECIILQRVRARAVLYESDRSPLITLFARGAARREESTGAKSSYIL